MSTRQREVYYLKLLQLYTAFDFFKQRQRDDTIQFNSIPPTLLMEKY